MEEVPRAIKWEDEKTFIPNFKAIEKELVKYSISKMEFKEVLSCWEKDSIRLDSYLMDTLGNGVLVSHCTRFKKELEKEINKYLGGR